MFHIESYRTQSRFIGSVVTLRISTVELPGDYGYETCVFKRNGDSDVIESYKTLDEAVAGHYHHAKYYGCNTIHIK